MEEPWRLPGWTHPPPSPRRGHAPRVRVHGPSSALQSPSDKIAAAGAIQISQKYLELTRARGTSQRARPAWPRPQNNNGTPKLQRQDR